MSQRLFLTLPCVEDVDVTLTFAYLEPDQLLRMPHSVQKVIWYKIYGETISLSPIGGCLPLPRGLNGAIKNQFRVVLAPRDAVVARVGPCIQLWIEQH